METYTLPFDQKPTHYNDCFDCTTFTVKKAIFCKHNMCWSFVGRYCILIMGTGKTNKSWAEETNTHIATIFSLTKQACRKDMMVWHEIETVVSPFKNIFLFFFVQTSLLLKRAASFMMTWAYFFTAKQHICIGHIQISTWITLII